MDVTEQNQMHKSDRAASLEPAPVKAAVTASASPCGASSFSADDSLKLWQKETETGASKRATELANTRGAAQSNGLKTGTASHSNSATANSGTDGAATITARSSFATQLMSFIAPTNRPVPDQAPGKAARAPAQAFGRVYTRRAAVEEQAEAVAGCDQCSTSAVPAKSFGTQLMSFIAPTNRPVPDQAPGKAARAPAQAFGRVYTRRAAVEEQAEAVAGCDQCSTSAVPAQSFGRVYTRRPEASGALPQSLRHCKPADIVDVSLGIGAEAFALCVDITKTVAGAASWFGSV